MNDLVTWIQGDWRSHPGRVCLEVFGMLLSLLVALLIALTTPHPPLVWCYILWNTASLCLLLAAISRGSLGFSMLYSGFLVIDTFGLWRTL